MVSLRQDAVYALRGLARRPAFTAVVLATLALGIGANAAIFSVVNGILLRPLPYPRAELVFSFGHQPPQWLTSGPNFLDYKRDMHSLDGLAAYTRSEMTLTSGDEPERVRVVRASEDFFPVLGVKPMLGRPFVSDEYQTNPPTVVVVSYDLWRRRFSEDRAIVGSTIQVAGSARTVVGVMPPNFDFPERRTDLWMPLPQLNAANAGDRSNNYLFMVGRRKDGLPLERSRTEAMTTARSVMRDFPQNFDPKSPLVPNLTDVREELVGKTRPYLIALLGAVGFVLLIACANVANLLLVRGEGRRGEMAVRAALGASTRRLATQLLTESAVLALGGGIVGLAAAWAAARGLVAMAPLSIPRLAVIGFDGRVLAFGALVSVVTGLLVGLLPAWRVSQTGVAAVLKEGGKTTGTRGVSRGARGALVVAEVALAVVMLAGAGMLLRSLWHLQGESLGIDPSGVLTAKVSIQAREYDDARSTVFFEQLLERVRALPGVRAAGASGWLPVVDAGGLWGFQPEGGNYPDGGWPSAVPQQVTPGYFAAVGMRMVGGREFGPEDRDSSILTAIVSKRFADLAWPGQSPLGKRFKLGGDNPHMTVVGLVDDFRARGFGDTPEPTMYFPYAQAARSAYVAPRSMALVMRVDGNPMAIVGGVREALRSLDRTAPLSEVRTMEQIVGTSVANRRFTTSLLAGFAILALVLAGIGTYGVISYSVSQRTYEIGVRMALGAEQREVLGLVMREGLRMCAVGLALGLVGALALGRGIRALLVGVPTIDPATLAFVCLVLMVVSVVACALPARRAMAVSPTEALKGG